MTDSRLQEERNEQLGQVWTPDHLADKMVDLLLSNATSRVTILDPACGPGTFSKALARVRSFDGTIDCYDVDSRMTNLATNINQELSIKGSVFLKDYLLTESTSKTYDAVILNPPYIRHELIDRKNKLRYQSFIKDNFDQALSKRSNLYVYFLLRSLVDTKIGGVVCAIIYDSLGQTAYGRQAEEIIRKYANVAHRIKVKAPFDGVIVDAEIILLKRGTNFSNKVIKPSFRKNGYVELGKLISVRRGTSLPLRRVYLSEPASKFYCYATPFLHKHKNSKTLLVQPDARVYSRDSISKNKSLDRFLKNRQIQLGSKKPMRMGALISGKIVFNYYIRNNPRHFFNADNIAVADNFYVGISQTDLSDAGAWLLLNSDVVNRCLVDASRNQGNGLRKLQLYEYKSVLVPDWSRISMEEAVTINDAAKELIAQNAPPDKVKETANYFINSLYRA